MILVYEDVEYPLKYDFGYGCSKKSAEFMFFKGNYSCDCNLSSFLGMKYWFPELPCGNKIKIKNFEVLSVPAPDDIIYEPLTDGVI